MKKLKKTGAVLLLLLLCAGFLLVWMETGKQEFRLPEAEHRILSLDVMKGKSLFEAEVLSFKRLIHRILSRLGGGSGKVLSRSGRAMLLISSLSTLSGDLEWFKDMQGKPSMVLALLKLIEENANA